jgi:hypothetical protein
MAERGLIPLSEASLSCYSGFAAGRIRKPRGDLPWQSTISARISGEHPRRGKLRGVPVRATLAGWACVPRLRRRACGAKGEKLVRATGHCYCRGTARLFEEQAMSDVSRRWVLGSFMVALTVAPRGILLAAEAAPVPEKRLALRGYDPVSYFTEGRPEQGSVEYQAAFDDATYWFKGPEHRATFVTDPDHYAPQFRGFCTVTLSRGAKYEADPEAWVIADGKLYVFGSKEGVPVFRAQTASTIEKATENWAMLRDSP